MSFGDLFAANVVEAEVVWCKLRRVGGDWFAATVASQARLICLSKNCLWELVQVYVDVK